MSAPPRSTTSWPTVRLHVRTVAIADPGQLLSHVPAHVRPLVWVHDGDGMVAWGETIRIDTAGSARFDDARNAWDEIRHRCHVSDEVGLAGTGAVAFGSFAYSARSRSGGSLIIPRVLLGRRSRHAWASVAWLDGEQVDVDAEIAQAVANDRNRTQPTSTALAHATSFTAGALSDAQWVDAVRTAVRLIHAGAVEKVVLARDQLATTPQPIDVRAMLCTLAENYPTCWTFAVDGFVGATPEMLIKTEDGQAISRVLAGTIARGESAATLVQSAKDLEEHQFSVSSVARALAPYCMDITVPDHPFVLELPNVLHLASDVTGVLADREDGPPTSLELAAALHPSAAVCGTPTHVADDIINELESMDRDRYAGPVGWLAANGDGEWGIGLRSGRLDAADPCRIRLFAGCGIVEGSTPEAELAETEAKFVPMRSALGPQEKGPQAIA